MAYTPEQYAAAGQFILANLDNPDLIASTASSLGLSANDLLAAAQTVNQNVTLQDVTGYFQQADTTYQPPVYTPEPVTSVAPLTSVAYQYATAPGGIGLDAMNQNIRDFFAANPTEEATRAAMSEYSVSDEDIRRATGKSLADYYPGALPTGGATSSGGALPTSGTYTEDRYNPNDPASSRYIADPNAGQYVFDPVTGKHTLVPSTGALSTGFDAYGNPRGATWTEDRYNPNDPTSRGYIADPNAGRYVFDPATGNYALTPTPYPKEAATVSLASSGTGNVAPIGSLAYRWATGKGGIGLDALNQNILNYLATNPTEAATLAEAKKWGVSKEDIERATGKSYEQIFPETFKPGSVLSSGFGNVTEQLGGSGYYKGVAIPTFYEQSLGDAGWLSVADQLATWKANIDKQDLSARAPFGFVETPIYSPGSGDSDAYLSGYQSTPATALDYLTKNNPVIANAILGHTSTDARAYKVVNGQLQEVGHDEITPEDLAEGNAFFMLAGATGGFNRERMAQFYRADGDNLIPVGDPKMYQGAKETNMGLAFLDMAASALAFVPGPWQIPATIYKVARAAEQGDWGRAALAAIPVIGDVANAAAIASEAAQVAGAVESASFANDIVNAVSSVIPSLDSVGKVTNALQQSVSALKAIDDENWLGLVASGTGLAGLTGVIDANTAGLIRSTANLANVLNNNGSPAQIISAATSLANNQGFLDRATADQFNAVASIIAAKGNPEALLGAVAQAARSGVFNDTAKIGAQYEQLNSRGVIDEYNVTGGGGALITSGNPTEDQQIALLQRQNAADQALRDYVGPGNDLSREGFVSQLQSLGFTKAQAEGYAQQADQQINMNLVGADVTNRYSNIDPEFGTPQLDRNTAVKEMVAAGFTSDRANEILNDIDAQNASKLENRLNVQAAYNDLVRGTGTTDQLRSAMMLAGYTNAEINNIVTRGNAVLEGKRLTSGEQAQELAANLPNIRAEIAGKSSFNEAYALAREKLGAGATFTWQGKDYVASSAAERPDLTGVTKTTTSTAVADTPYVAPNGMHNRASFIAAGGGTSDADYAKYVQAVNAVIAEGKSGTLIKPASVNSTGKELPPTTGPVTMEKPSVDSVLGSVAAQGVASFGANSIAGGLSALGFTDAGAAVLNKANQIANAATAAEGADITRGKADINVAIQKVGQSSGIKDFAANIGNLASTAFNNPKAFGATVGSEVVEELLQLATVKFPANFLVKETVASALENGGAAYNTEYASQIAKGASKEDAHQAAQKAAGTAAAVTVGLAGAAAGVSKVVGKVLGSQADEVPTSGIGQVGKTTVKESAQETVEEGSISGMIDLALNRPVDAVNMLTNMTGGALYGGPTSGVMQATKLDTLDQTASTSIGAGINNQLSTELAAGANPATAISSAVNSGMTSTGANSTTVLNGVVSSGLSNGVDPATVVSSTLTGALNNNVNLDTALSTVVGSAISNNVNPSTVVTSAIDSTLNNSNVNSLAAATMASNAAINSSLGVTGSATTAVTNVVAGTLNSNLATAVGANGATTLAVNAGVSTAISNSVNPGTAISSTVNAAISNGSNVSTAVATAVATALASGVDTTTAVNSALSTNNNTGLTVNTNTTNNTNTAVVTDTKNNTVTQVTNNNNSGITTSVVTNNNTGSTVTTSINNNSGVVTTTTVDGNIKTDVVVDTTNNTTTTVATDTKTGQIINIDTVVGGTGNDVVTEPPPVVTEPPPVITEPPPVITQPPVTVTPQTKTTTPQPKTGGALSSLLIGGGSGFGALPGNLSPSMLEGAPIEALMNLPQLVQLYPQLANVDPRLLQMLSGRAGAQASYGMGDAGNLPTALSMTQAGAEPSPGMPVKAAKAATTNQDTKLLGGTGPLSGKLDALTAAGLTALNTGLGYAKGGLSHASGHNPEFITGATGYYVKGRGDGQSDDIPAMLADGEYVFDADTVAALGNGSSDAGAKILDKMRENIRKHKRSAHHSKIPPKAKSPLEYLKG